VIQRKSRKASAGRRAHLMNNCCGRLVSDPDPSFVQTPNKICIVIIDEIAFIHNSNLLKYPSIDQHEAGRSVSCVAWPIELPRVDSAHPKMRRSHEPPVDPSARKPDEMFCSMVQDLWHDDSIGFIEAVEQHSQRSGSEFDIVVGQKNFIATIAKS